MFRDALGAAVAKEEDTALRVANPIRQRVAVRIWRLAAGGVTIRHVSKCRRQQVAEELSLRVRSIFLSFCPFLCFFFRPTIGWLVHAVAGCTAFVCRTEVGENKYRLEKKHFPNLNQIWIL